MGFVIAEPSMMASAAAEIEGIGSALSAANAAAAAPTAGLVAAAGGGGWAAIANPFGSYGQEYQAILGQFELFQNQFQQTLATAATAYADAEAAITAALGTSGASVPALPAATIPPFPAHLTS